MRCLVHFAMGCVALLGGGLAQADPLAGGTLPASTRWVMHIDVDGARLATPLWELARVKIYEPRRADMAPRLAMLERAMGTRLPEDLHDVTLYSDTYDDKAVCIRIHGIMDKGNIQAVLRTDAAYSVTDYNKHDIVCWRDKGRDRLMYVGFDTRAPATGPGNTWAIVSPDLQALQAALDTMDGKGGLKEDSPLVPQSAGAAAGQPILWMAASHLGDLPRIGQVESPVLGQVSAGSVAVRWANERASMQVRLEAKDEKAAQQIQSIADGMKAFVALSAADEHALPRVRMLSSALQQLTVTTAGSTVKGEWTVDVESIGMLLSLAQQEAATRAAVPAATGLKKP